MKLINPKFAATACILACWQRPLLYLPVIVRHRHHHCRPHRSFPKPTPIARVAEPSTLVMTLAGMGLGIGLAVVGLRRNRSVTA